MLANLAGAPSPELENHLAGEEKEEVFFSSHSPGNPLLLTRKAFLVKAKLLHLE